MYCLTKTLQCSCIILLLAGGLASGLYAQQAPLTDTQPLPRPDEAPLRFDHLTIDDGLSQQSVYAILQDRHGFMWFGTQDGLNRYDGHTFKVYQHDPNDPGSLLPGWLYDMLEDRDGMLWLAQQDGLSRFDPGAETFTHYHHDDADPGSLSYNDAVTVYQDGQGILWVGTRTGLDRFNPDTETFSHFQPVTEEPEDWANWVGEILEDRSGMLWLGMAEGLIQYDRTTGAFTRFLLAPEAQTPEGANWMSALYEDRQGTLWVGAWGLYRFDRENEVFEGFFIDPQATEPSLQGPNRIHTIYEDDTRTLWVGGADGVGGPRGTGLTRFDRSRGTFTRYLHDPSDPRSLNDNNVYEIYQDRQGLLWVGTSGGGGLNRVDRTTRSFAKYPVGSSSPNSLQGGDPRGMYLDRDDVLWIGTSGGVLNRFDRRSGLYTHYHHDPADPYSLPPGPILTVHRDRQGKLWITGGDDGISRLNEETGRFIHYRNDPNDSTSIAGSARNIYEDRDGNLWIGAAGGGGLQRFNRETGTFTHYDHNPDDSTSIGGFARVIFEDLAGQLWIGTSGAGPNRFDPETGTFIRYEHDENDPQSLNDNSVYGIYERPREPGILWVATTSGGLNRFDVRTGRFTHYTSQNSDLPNNMVYCVLGDEEGYLWMSTNTGLARFNPDTEQFKVFTAEDGLQMLEFDFWASHKGYNGELFFGGAGGVNAIRPGEVFDNPHPPEVALTGLRLFNEPVTPGPDALLQTSITETEAVTLAHDQNDLTLEYIGLHFRHPERNEYAYMLEGYDDAWREVGTERRASYTNLPPGDYTFRVKASNSDGVWNEEGRSLAITILPPWWRTWWAYGFYGLLCIAGIAALNRYQHRRLIRKAREKARERELKHAKEIEQAYHQLEETHSNLKKTQQQLVQSEKMASLGQLTAGIAHELKNPLNFVNNFGQINEELASELNEQLEAQGDALGDLKKELQDVIASFKTNSRHIVKHGKRADQIVQSMMQHAGQSEGRRYRIEVNPFVDECVNVCSHGLKSQMPDIEVAVTRDFDERVGTLEIAPQDMSRVLQNLLNNAFEAVREKAAKVNGAYQPEVSVSTRKKEDSAEIRICDNGPGIPEEIKGKIFEPFFTTKPTGSGTGLGLSLSYDIIVKGHGGSLRVESEIGEGAAFVITLPAKKETVSGRPRRGHSD